MGALTPQFLMDLESRMQILMESEYSRFSGGMWWDKICRARPSNGRRELITWLLSTAQIKDQGKGGNFSYDDLVSVITEYEHKAAGAALELHRYQLEDTDGGGMDLAGQWATDIGAYIGYWPQKQATNFLKTAHLTGANGGFTAYDNLAFFSASHLVNPLDSSKGTFANLFTGAASGAYPGALPIDDSVSPETALQNLGKLRGYVAGIKMPNGEDPRFLRPVGLLCPPTLMPRAVQLTSAKFIGQTTGSYAASADVEALIKYLGFATPIQADELQDFESNTTYYVIMETLASSQLGAVIYGQREPFKVNFYGPMDQATLARKQKLEWLCSGRNTVAPGHPYLLLKVKGS